MSLSVHFNLPVADAALQSLVDASRFGRHLEDFSLPQEGARRLVFDNARASLARSDIQAATVSSEENEMEGLLLFRLSAWDSEHFGFPFAMIDSFVVRPSSHSRQLEIARLLLKEFGEWCRRDKIRFVSIRVPALDLPVIHALEETGFRFMESWIYNKVDLAQIRHPAEPPPALRLSVPEDRELMLAYSASAFATQRFHADSGFDPVKADSLYRKWIDTAFDDPNQLIAVLESEGVARAFMVYYKSDLRPYVGRQFTMWKMALLDPESRGQGLGTKFFAALMQHHRNEGMDVIDSGLSMRNTASLHLHNKNHFKVVSTLITFHKWLPSSQG